MVGIISFYRDLSLSSSACTPISDVGAYGLLDGESQGFAIDATTYPAASALYVGGPLGGTVTVIDTTTPANNLINVALDRSNLVQGSTSPKFCHSLTAPYVRWSAHNYSENSTTDPNAWDFVNLSLVSSNNIAPDGTATARLMKAVAGDNLQDVFGSDWSYDGRLVHTASVYAKAGTHSFVDVAISSYSSGTYWLRATANVSTGVITATDSGINGFVVSSAIEDAGNGWYRISITGYFNSNDGAMKFGLAEDATPEGANFAEPTWVAAGTETALFWGMQVNKGHRPTPRMGALTQGIPQSYDSAAGKYGILVEPAATNLHLRSEDFDTDWSDTNSTTSVNTTDTTAPDGSYTADKVALTGAGFISDGTSKTIVANSVYTSSVYVKVGTGANFLCLQVQDAAFTNAARYWFNLGTGATASISTVAGTVNDKTSTITAIGDGWYRCTATFSYNNTTLRFVLSPTDTDGVLNDGDSGDIHYYWGMQAELGTVATSYMPSRDGTVTRAIDNISGSASLFPYSATASTVYLDFKARVISTDNYYWNLYKDNTHRMELHDASGNGSHFSDGGIGSLAISGGTVVVNTRTQVAAAIATNDADISQDGAAIVSDSVSVTMPNAATILNIGIYGGGTNAHNGFIYRLVYVPVQVQTRGSNLATWRYNF